MTNEMKGTRTSQRLVGLQAPTVGCTNVGSTGTATAVPQEVGRGDQGKSVYVPCWNISKVSRLTAVGEKNEWVDNIMPPGARTKYTKMWSKAVGWIITSMR